MECILNIDHMELDLTTFIDSTSTNFASHNFFSGPKNHAKWGPSACTCLNILVDFISNFMCSADKSTTNGRFIFHKFYNNF